MTWLREGNPLGPRRYAVGRARSGGGRGGPAESYSAGGGAAARPSKQLTGPVASSDAAARECVKNIPMLRDLYTIKIRVP